MFNKKNKLDIEGLNEIIFLGKKLLKLFFVVLCISVVFVGFILLKEIGVFGVVGSILNVLAPLFIGFVVAWLFAPMVNRLTKKGMSRILASTIVYVVFVAFLVIFFRVFIPIIYNEINELINTLPAIISKITEFVNELFSKINAEAIDINGIKENVLGAITTYSNEISKNLPTTIVSVMSDLVSGLGTIFFGLIIGLYMLFDFDNVTNLLLKVIPHRYQMEVANLVDNIGTEVRKCVNGTLLVACMVFVCDTIGFSILGLKSALLFGLFCGITDLIPYIGPWIGTAVVTVVGLTQSPLIGLGVFIIALVVQLVESYILQPVVMSKATNLHPVTIICGLLIFGHFFGIVGMILATPIMSIIKVIWIFTENKFALFKENDVEEVAEKA